MKNRYHDDLEARRRVLEHRRTHEWANGKIKPHLRDIHLPEPVERLKPGPQPNTYPRVFKPGDADWMTDAACRGLDPSLFFPPTGPVPREPIAVCDRCPVKAQCAAHALAEGEKDGVWGGLTAAARRRIRSQNRQAS